MNTINSLKFRLLISGLISGILSTYLTRISELSNYFMFIPGIIFGIVMFLVFYKSIGKNLIIRLVWILGSTFAYYMAVKIFIVRDGDLSALFLAGVVGGFIMITFFHLAFFPVKPAQFFMLSLLGGVLALSMYIPNFLASDPTNIMQSSTLSQGMSYLLIIWQAGMAFALGWAVDSNQQMQ